MKKMIAVICVLLVIFVGMLIKQSYDRQQKQVTADEVQKIESLIGNVYTWKEITGEALPTFEQINQAPERWIWEVVKKNLEEYSLTRNQLQEKAKEIFGLSFSQEFPEQGNEAFAWQEETEMYVPTEIQIDEQDDLFLIDQIRKKKNGYEVQIMEYLEDYSSFENHQIRIENLQGDIICSLDSAKSETEVIDVIKENSDRFSKKKITIEKGEGDKLIITRVDEVK